LKTWADNAEGKRVAREVLWKFHFDQDFVWKAGCFESPKISVKLATLGIVLVKLAQLCVNTFKVVVCQVGRRRKDKSCLTESMRRGN
jgi:hypothetical protein